MTPPNFGAPGGALWSSSHQITTHSSADCSFNGRVHRQPSLTIPLIYMLNMLADNILYTGPLLPSLSCPPCPLASRRLRRHPVAVTTEPTTIHPGFLRQFLPALLEQSSFGVLRTRSIQRCCTGFSFGCFYQ